MCRTRVTQKDEMRTLAVVCSIKKLVEFGIVKMPSREKWTKDVEV